MVLASKCHKTKQEKDVVLEERGFSDSESVCRVSLRRISRMINGITTDAPLCVMENSIVSTPNVVSDKKTYFGGKGMECALANF